MRHSFKRSLLTVGLFLSCTVAQGVTTFRCAPEAHPAFCTSAGLWSVFEENSRRGDDGEYRYLISDYLKDDEATALRLAVREEGVPSAEVTALVARLPVAAQLAWKLAVGEITPTATAHGARALGDIHGQEALLLALTNLDRDAALVEALSWTLDQESTRAITQPWFLLAGENMAVNIALNELIQCSHDGEDGCASALPPAVIFSLAQVQAAWPSLSVDSRRGLLWRTSGEGIEEFLRGALQREGNSDALTGLWTDEAAADARVEAVVAQLILERLLDPAVAGSSRLQMPITGASSLLRPQLNPLATAEIGAWKRLAAGESSASGLWTALASSGNPWVMTLGVAGLLAADHQEEASKALALLLGADAVPSKVLAELLVDVDTAAVDQVFRRILSVAPSNIEQACALSKTISADRAQRLIPEMVGWVQVALAGVPDRLVPSLAELSAFAGRRPQAGPFADTICVLERLPKPTKESVADLQQLADWLGQRSTETFRLFGALLSAELGDLHLLEAWLQATASTDSLDSRQLHEQLQKALDRLRAEYSARRDTEARQLCHLELQNRGVDLADVSSEQWSAQAEPGESTLLTLSIPGKGDTLHAQCRVDFSAGARVIMMQVKM